MLPMYEVLVICFNPAFGAWHWISEMIKSRVERAIQFFWDGPFLEFLAKSCPKNNKLFLNLD